MGRSISRFTTVNSGKSRSLIDNLLDFIGLCTACIGRYNFTEGGRPQARRSDARVYAPDTFSWDFVTLRHTLISQTRHVCGSVAALIGRFFKTYPEKNASTRRSTRQCEFSPIEIISGSHSERTEHCYVPDESHT